MREAFAFFENPRNLARITPPWLDFRIVSPARIQLRKGAELEYQIRLMRVPLRWKAVIAEYEPPFFFVDEQVHGPYAYWRHRHDFRPGEFGAMVSDRVEYALPLGPLGELARWLFVERQLRAIFDYRQALLGEILSGMPTAR